MISFEFMGVEITNPFISECGRFETSPEYYGFKIIGTGGGCTAWVKTVPDGIIAITEDLTAPKNAENPAEIIIGLYPSEELFDQCIDWNTLQDAIEAQNEN